MADSGFPDFITEILRPEKVYFIIIEVDDTKKKGQKIVN